MNARTQYLELDVEGRQIDEAVTSLFHTLLLHRSTGKFHYADHSSYAVGSVGFQDVDCDFIDFTYVKTSSSALDQSIHRNITEFSEAIRSNTSSLSGQIVLEFYQRKKGRWPFASECIPWEVWTVKINLVTPSNEHERQIWRMKVGNDLGEKFFYITDILNRQDYIPSPPKSDELDLIYDTSFPDIQPYLFKMNYSLCASSVPSVATTVKKLINKTLAFT